MEQSQDEYKFKFIFGSLIIDNTMFCRLNVDNNKSVYKILSRWIKMYEEELKNTN